MLEIYKNQRVFITGHTGFKGSWLAYMLYLLGAKVKGYSLSPVWKHSHFNLLQLDKLIENEYNDIRNIFGLIKSIEKFKPTIIISAAAQPLVLESYRYPITTFNTNIIGTANLLEACRNIESLKGIVLITTDKIYENKESKKGYTEEDRLGCYDPYSASKVCAEVIIDCYRKSFYKDTTLVASVRAGNTIGGGDWGVNRLIPDIIKTVYENKNLDIRSPESIRPWTYILDVLSGYLLLGQKLLEGKKEFQGAWNFGSDETNFISVQELLNKFSQHCKVNYTINLEEANKFKETNILKLDSSKAKKLLKWKPKVNIDEAIQLTSEWYSEYYTKGNIITETQILNYLK